MLYMFLLTSDPQIPVPGDALERHFKFLDHANKQNAYITSEAFGDVKSAKTIRIRRGDVSCTDGPFAETSEVLGGYYLLDCENIDAAIEFAKKIPDAAWGAVEIRPVWNVPNWPYAVAADRRES